MNLISQLITLFVFAIFARSILSFFPIRYDSPLAPVVRILHQVTEPVLAPVRRMLPPMGGLDLSPLVVIIGLQILAGILIR